MFVYTNCAYKIIHVYLLGFINKGIEEAVVGQNAPSVFGEYFALIFTHLRI